MAKLTTWTSITANSDPIAAAWRYYREWGLGMLVYLEEFEKILLRDLSISSAAF